MNLQNTASFAAATLLICAIPGPNMLYVMTSAVRHGFRRTFYSMAGCFLAVMILIALSVAGVGAVLKASPVLFKWLRYAGAVYLVYLGIQAWRAPADRPTDKGNAMKIPAASAAALFRRGFTVGISNPKALLFAAAFFPQFIDPHLPGLPQFAILLGTFGLLEFSCYTAYASGGVHLAVMLSHPSVRRRFNQCTAILFSLFGILLVVKAN